MALPMFFLQSCLKDQEDIFDKSSSLRMQEYQAEAKAALIAPEHGWVFEIFPHKEQKYGGYAFTCKFDAEQVTAKTELALGQERTSYYGMTNDMGPVLTFDTYNEFMHFFSTPSAKRYQGYNGDFEYIIDSIGADKMKVHAKRTGNILYMYKLTESADTYLQKVAAMTENFQVGLVAGAFGSTTLKGSFDLDSRQLIYKDGKNASAEEQAVAFVFTSTGIRFYRPINMGGISVSSFDFNADNLKLEGKDANGNAVTLQCSYPEGYAPFDLYAGNYVLTYDTNKTINVTLTANADKTAYLMSGLNANYQITLPYNKSTGVLSFNSQKIGEVGGKTVMICAWDLAHGGYLSWDTKMGMVTQWNGDKTNPVFNFVDNKADKSFVTDSYILWTLNADGSSAGQLTVSSWFINSNNRIPNIKSLTKQ